MDTDSRGNNESTMVVDHNNDGEESIPDDNFPSGAGPEVIDHHIINDNDNDNYNNSSKERQSDDDMTESEHSETDGGTANNNDIDNNDNDNNNNNNNQQEQQQYKSEEEQLAIIQTIEEKCKEEFPVSETSFWKNSIELKKKLWSFSDVYGFKLSPYGSSFRCIRSAAPPGRLNRKDIKPPKCKKRNRTSIRCGCDFIIKFAPVTKSLINTVGAPKDAVRISYANYKHTNGCIPGMTSTRTAFHQQQSSIIKKRKDNCTKYFGGCHCGAIRFKIRVNPLAAKITICNCSMCTKKGYIHLIIHPSQFTKLKSYSNTNTNNMTTTAAATATTTDNGDNNNKDDNEDEDDDDEDNVNGDNADTNNFNNFLSTYTFNTGIAKHYFCKICGIHSYYRPRSHPRMIDINLRCLDNYNEKVKNEFNNVEYFDGTHYEENIDQLLINTKSITATPKSSRKNKNGTTTTTTTENNIIKTDDNEDEKMFY